MVCNASIADEDVLEWLKANAYSDLEGSLSWADDEYWEVDEYRLLPCLFTRTGRDGAAGCQSAICQSDLGLSDPVWSDYGAAKIIAPLLER